MINYEMIVLLKENEQLKRDNEALKTDIGNITKELYNAYSKIKRQAETAENR